MVNGENLPAQGEKFGFPSVVSYIGSKKVLNIVEPPEHPKHRKVSPKDASVPVTTVTLRPRARKDSEVFVTEAFKEENHSPWLHESSLMLAW